MLINHKNRCLLAVFLFALFVVRTIQADSEPLGSGLQLFREGKSEKAHATLLKVAQDSNKDSQTKAAALFSLGLMSYTDARDAEAQDFLHQSIKANSLLEDYARYYLGLSYKRTGALVQARAEFEKIRQLKATYQMHYDARFALGEVAMMEKKWKAAHGHFAYLQRRLRNTERYPDVLWKLIGLERSLKKKWKSCRWARELYSKYPDYDAIREWGIDLQNNRYQGEVLGCLATTKEQQTRIRRLQWMGNSERALQELKTLQARATAETKYHVDSMLATYLTNEGHVDEALRILLAHYEKQGNDVNYLMLLGKAASIVGQVQTAVGAYYKAHKINPRGPHAKTALYHSAFLSYQFQDYDGAGRKFEQFRKTYPRSGLSRDAQWHLAWIRYLKSDYLGSYKAFSEIMSAKRGPKRVRRSLRKYSEEHIRYWMAMSLLKLGKPHEAKPIFEKLAQDTAYGYYSILSSNRLATIKVETPVMRTLAQDPASSSATMGLALGDSVLPHMSAVTDDGTQSAEAEESESEESLAVAEERGELEEDGADVADGEDVAVMEGEEPSQLDGETVKVPEGPMIFTNFRDPVLARRFERARFLTQLGLKEEARFELYEIEKRSRNPDYRKTLISEYQTINSFHRSSYIGEVYFGEQRARDGIFAARPLWEATYPRAFERDVVMWSKKFSVPEGVIWGIMRAESRYKPDIISPVGAMGLLQLMPYTARQVANLLEISNFQAERLKDPAVNIQLGTRYLQKLMDKFERNIPLTAAGYNAGPHRVQAWLKSFGQLDADEFIEHIPFLETRNYVKRVVRNYQIYSLLYEKAPRPLDWLTRPAGVQFDEPVPTREIW